MVPTDFELISRAVGFTIDHALRTQEKVVEDLQHSASSVLVATLRTLTMQSTIVAIGTVSVFESLLQQHYGWMHTFRELDHHLRNQGYTELANRFRDFRDAINVLKHGRGDSYKRLSAKRSKLPFLVKGEDEAFFEEGDVSDVTSLVDARPEFVRQCVDVIEDVIAALGEHPPNGA